MTSGLGSDASTPDTDSVDDLLDFGARGLTFFAAFLPLLERTGTPPSRTYDELCALHDQQRGLDLRALEDDAVRLRQAANGLREELDAQTVCRTDVAASWGGPAADAALATMDAQLDRCGGDVERMEAAATAVEAGAPALRAVVTDKVKTAADFARSDVGGRDAEQVAAIVSAATSNLREWGEGDLLTLATVFPGLGDALLAARPSTSDVRVISDRVAAECRSWLETVFVPTVTERITRFDELCAATDSAVSEIFRAMGATVDDVPTDPYPGPADCGCDTDAAATTRPAGVLESAAESNPHTTAPDAPVSQTVRPTTALPLHSDSPLHPSSPPHPSYPLHPALPTDPAATTVSPPSDAPCAPETVSTRRSALTEVVAEAVRVALDQRHRTSPVGVGPAAFDDAAAAPPGTQCPDVCADQVRAEEVRPGSGQSGHIEAALGDTRLRMDVAPDGTVEIDTEAGGHSRTFEIRLGTHGLPEIHEVSPGGNDDGPVEPTPAEATPAAAIPTEPIATEPIATEPTPARQIPAEPSPEGPPVDQVDPPGPEIGSNTADTADSTAPECVPTVPPAAAGGPSTAHVERPHGDQAPAAAEPEPPAPEPLTPEPAEPLEPAPEMAEAGPL